MKFEQCIPCNIGSNRNLTCGIILFLIATFCHGATEVWKYHHNDYSGANEIPAPNGLLVMSSSQGDRVFLRALNQDTGTISWEKELNEGYRMSLIWALDGNIWGFSNNTMTLIDPDNGNFLKVVRLPEPKTERTRLALHPSGNLIYQTDQSISSVNLDTGELFWSFYSEGMIVNGPEACVDKDGRVLFGTAEIPNVPSTENAIYVLDGWTGSEIWKIPARIGSNKPPIIIDGYGALFQETEQLLFLDPTDGEIKVELPLEAADYWKFPFSDGEGNFYWTDSDILSKYSLTEGRKLWSKQLEWGILTPFLLSSDKIMASTRSGFSILSTEDGEEIEAVPIDLSWQQFYDIAILENGLAVMKTISGYGSRQFNYTAYDFGLNGWPSSTYYDWRSSPRFNNMEKAAAMPDPGILELKTGQFTKPVRCLYDDPDYEYTLYLRCRGVDQAPVSFGTDVPWMEVILSPESVNSSWQSLTVRIHTSQLDTGNNQGHLLINSPSLYFKGSRILHRSHRDINSWELSLNGLLYNSPIWLGDEKLLVTSQLESELSKIYCINRETREIIWEKSVVAGNIPPLSWENGRIFMVNSAGDMTCLSIEDGTELWSKQFSYPFTQSVTLGWDNTIFAHNENGDVYAVNRDDGSIRWQASLTRKGLFQLILTQDGVLLNSYSNESGREEGIEALDSATGQRLWIKVLPSFDGRMSMDASGAVIYGQFFLDPPTGTILSRLFEDHYESTAVPLMGNWDGYYLPGYNQVWNRNFDIIKYFGSVQGGYKICLAPGNHLIYSDSTGLHCILMNDGSEVWDREIEISWIKGLTYTNDGTLYLLDATELEMGALKAISIPESGVLEGAWPRFQGDIKNSGRQQILYEEPLIEPFEAWCIRYGIEAIEDADFDGDQVSNLIEYIIGTDPSNSISCSPEWEFTYRKPWDPDNPNIQRIDIQMELPIRADQYVRNIEWCLNALNQRWFASEVSWNYSGLDFSGKQTAVFTQGSRGALYLRLLVTKEEAEESK